MTKTQSALFMVLVAIALAAGSMLGSATAAATTADTTTSTRNCPTTTSHPDSNYVRCESPNTIPTTTTTSADEGSTTTTTLPGTETSVYRPGGPETTTTTSTLPTPTPPPRPPTDTPKLASTGAVYVELALWYGVPMVALGAFLVYRSRKRKQRLT